jgi:CHAD domain-containing protein
MFRPRIEETIQTPNQLLLDGLDIRWNNYCTELERCRAEFSDEAVHDVRVALRRLLSLIKLLNSIDPHPRLRKLSRTFKRQLDEFDDLRDTQVMLAETSETIKELPQLEKLQGHLENNERKLLKDLRKELKKLDLTGIARSIQKTRESLSEEGKDDTAEPILQSVDDAFLVTQQRNIHIDPAQPATIHRVRVAFKNFRYMVEIVHPMLKGFPEENLKLMNDCQSMMGEIQDLEVILKTLADFPQTTSSIDVSDHPSVVTSLEPVCHYYELHHSKAVSKYIKNKNMLNRFWRPSPEKPFPWEKTK